jgi:hypothetical protein
MWVEKWAKAEKIWLLRGGINPQRWAREDTGPCKPGGPIEAALSWPTKITIKIQARLGVGTWLTLFPFRISYSGRSRTETWTWGLFKVTRMWYRK